MKSGADPMNDPPRPADADRVTTTATPEASQQGRFGRNALREAQALDSETRTDQVDQMRNLIQRPGYRVDPNAVAEAIIARLKAGGAVRDGARSPSSSRRPRAR
jgi:anti-sigma28 factor (negative regulator of flagellin synthesis)